MNEETRPGGSVPLSLRILFFGATAEIAGAHMRQIEITPPCTASELIDRIVADHPGLRRHRLFFSVDQEYVPDDVILKDGDELAIFTAVSGG